MQAKGRNTGVARLESANVGAPRNRSTSSSETRKTRGSSIASGGTGRKSQSHVVMATRRQQHYGWSGNEENEEHISGEHFRF